MRKRLGGLLVCGIAAFLPLVCAGCVFSKETPQVMHTHNFVFDHKVEPTCMEQGYEVWICTDDPTHTVKKNFIPVDNEAHEWVKGDFFAPNVLGDGYDEYICKHNGAHTKHENFVDLTDYINGTNGQDPHPKYDGHEWVAQGTVLPTCVAGGYTVYKCALDHTVENFDYVTLEEYQTGVVNKEYKDGHIETIPPHANYDGHEWVAGETVLPTCIADGYTVYTCALDGSARQGDAVTLAEYLVDNPTYDGYGWEAVETVDPTCSALGYTIYEGKYSKDYITANPNAAEFPNGTELKLHTKHDDFKDVLPDEHKWSGFVAYPEGAANADHPTILRDTCTDSVFPGDGTAPTYCIMPDELLSKYYSADETPLPPYYVVSEEHHLYRYETENMPIDGAGVQVTETDAVRWFNLPFVSVDTFVEFSLTLADDAVGTVSLYEFDADYSAFDEFTEEQTITEAVTAVDFLNGTRYVTLRASKIYFVKVSAPAAGDAHVAKIWETDTEMLENLIIDGGVTEVTKASPNLREIVKVKIQGGDEIVIDHSKDSLADACQRTKEITWRKDYKYTKIYRYGEDIFTFALVKSGFDISQENYASLTKVIETVIDGFGFEISAPDDYYVWAFTGSGTGIDGYYGFEEVVVIPSGITSITSSIGQQSFSGNQAIREIVFAPPYAAAITIGQGTFENCRGLEVFELPPTGIQVGNNAFRGCGSLKFVYYDGAYAYPLSGITINSMGNADLADNIIYRSDSAPTPVGNEKYWHYDNNNQRVIWNNGRHTVTFKSLAATVGSYTGEAGSIIPEQSALPPLDNLEFQYWYYILESNNRAYEIQYTNQRISGAIQNMTLYAKYKSLYTGFGEFEAVNEAAIPVAGIYPAVNRLRYTSNANGRRFEYYLYFNEGECAAEYYSLLQLLYVNNTHIVSYRFGAEIFLAYGNGEVTMDISGYKGQTVPTDEYNKESGYYPLSRAEFGDIGLYIAKLFESWSPAVLTDEESVEYLPTDMDFKFKVIEDLISSAKLLIVNIGTENGTQSMEDVLTHNLPNATEIMREGKYLFMLINTATVTSNDLAGILGITDGWDETVDEVGLLPNELRAYYDEIKSDGGYTEPQVTIENNGAKSISFTNTDMSVEISSGVDFNTLVPDNRYVTLFNGLVFTFTPTLNGMLIEEQIDELMGILDINAWGNAKKGGTVAVLTEAEHNIAVSVVNMEYYDPNKTNYSSGNAGIKYSMILKIRSQAENYGVEHTMEFYIYDDAPSDSAMSELSNGAGVNGVYRKDNIVLVYKNIAGGGMMGLTPAEVLELLVYEGDSSMQMKPMTEIVCDNYGDKSGDWDYYQNNLL